MAVRTVSSLRFRARNIGKSLVFNGSSDYVTCPVVPSTTAFSIGFWFKNQAQVANKQLISWNSTSGNDGFNMGMSAIAGSFNFGTTIRNSTTSDVFSYKGDAGKPDKWCHVVLTYKQNEAKLYINGILYATDTSCTMTQATGFPLTFGRASYSGIQFYQGSLAEFVFENNRSWSQSEVEDLCFRGIKSISATCSYDFNDNLNDTTGNGNNLTIGSGTSYSSDVPLMSRTTVSFRKSITQKSVYFNGTNSSISFGTESYGTTFSVGGWIYPLGNTGTAQNLISKRDSFGATTMVFMLYINAGVGGDLRIIGNAAGARTFGPYVFPLNTWTHFVFVSDGTAAANNRLYINGSFQSNASGGVTMGTGSSAINVIGGNQNPAQELFYGNMKDIFVANRALSATEISSIYARSYPRMFSLWNFQDESASSLYDYFSNKVATGLNTSFSELTPYTIARSSV